MAPVIRLGLHQSNADAIVLSGHISGQLVDAPAAVRRFGLYVNPSGINNNKLGHDIDIRWDIDIPMDYQIFIDIPIFPWIIKY